jgi:hypothetical protein
LSQHLDTLFFNANNSTSAGLYIFIRPCTASSLESLT